MGIGLDLGATAQERGIDLPLMHSSFLPYSVSLLELLLVLSLDKVQTLTDGHLVHCRCSSNQPFPLLLSGRCIFFAASVSYHMERKQVFRGGDPDFQDPGLEVSVFWLDLSELRASSRSFWATD